MAGDATKHMLSIEEIQQAFVNPQDAARFPPILTIEEAAELMRIPVATLYDWSSRGLLHDCARRVGKYLRFFRDRFVQIAFDGGFSNAKKR